MESPTTAPTRAGVAARLVGAWNALATRFDPYAVIVIACALLTVPRMIAATGYGAKEEPAVAIANTVIAEGVWRLPYALAPSLPSAASGGGLGWGIDHPPLLPWIIAALSAPFDGVTQVTARLPAAISLLCGALLVYWLLRRLAAGVPAALAGVVLFLACPAVLRLSVAVTWEFPVAVLLFFAFCLSWRAIEAGSIRAIGPARWLAIVAVLIVAALMKGPHVEHPAPPFANPVDPIARFLADAWPAILGAMLGLAAPVRRGGGVVGPPGFFAAAVCYTIAAGLFILVLPGGTTPRYYLPVVPILCVLAGLGYERLNAGLTHPASDNAAPAA
jgi:Dolichyl-phosphate-mannose-protein mannosyltransferase